VILRPARPLALIVLFSLLPAAVLSGGDSEAPAPGPAAPDAAGSDVGSDARSHYQEALRQSGRLEEAPCRHAALLDSLFEQLRQAVAKDDSYRQRALEDPGLAFARSSYRFYRALGFDPEKERDVQRILEGLTWYGADRGVWPPEFEIRFDTERATIRLLEVTTEGGDTRVSYRAFEGTYRRTGTRIEIRLAEPLPSAANNGLRLHPALAGRRVLTLTFADGALSLPGYDREIDSDPGRCSA
jgi:hypothetical protein